MLSAARCVWHKQWLDPGISFKTIYILVDLFGPLLTYSAFYRS